jgi:hypothetical protein
MKLMIIEISPRQNGQSYHACLQNTAIWGSGSTVELATVAAIRTGHDEFGITDDECDSICHITNSDKRLASIWALRDLVKLVRSRSIEIKFEYLPTLTR